MQKALKIWMLTLQKTGVIILSFINKGDNEGQVALCIQYKESSRMMKGA